MILESNDKLEQQILLPNHLTTLPTDSALENILEHSNRLFIRMEYSRNDMPKKAVRSIVDATLSNTLEDLQISQTTVAYSRPKNVKDLLSKAKLHQAKGKEVSVYYSGEPPSK